MAVEEDEFNIPIPPNWDCKRLEDLVDDARSIAYGIVQPGDYTGGGIPVVRVNNLRDGRVITTDVLRVSPSVEKKYRRTRLQGGEVLLSLVGTLGECAVVTDDMSGWNVARAVAVIPIKVGFDPTWIAICLRSRPVQNLIRGWATTTVQATLNLRDVRRLPVLVPPHNERRNITKTAKQLDDKIEQNRCTSAKLEELARAVFRAWFVDFAPVHAKAAGATTYPGLPKSAFDALPSTFVDSEMGMIPEGWEAANVGDIARQRRESVSGDELSPEEAYIGLEHLPRRSIMLDEWESAAKVTSNKSRFYRGDILFGKLRPYFHKVGPAPVDGVCSTDIVVIAPKESHWASWLLTLLSSDEFVGHAAQTSSGTKMPRTKWKDMAGYGIAKPTRNVVEAFETLVGPMVSWIESAIHESQRLAALRDYLLPRLLSGAVRVKEIEE